MKQAQLLRLLQTSLLAAGFFLLGWWFHGWNETRSFQLSAAQSLEEKRAALASLEQPRSASKKSSVKKPKGAPALRSVIGRIEIPRLKISAVIVEGTEPDILDRAVGHFASTALPGQPGNVGLAGHRDTFLRGLGRIRADDVVLISTPESTHRYVVERNLVVEPDSVEVLDATATPSLTLVTCYPFTFVGPAPQRFIVRATLEPEEPKVR